jgi:hypothetical protein
LQVVTVLYDRSIAESILLNGQVVSEFDRCLECRL